MIVERAVPDNTIRMDSFRVMRRSLFSTASLYLDFSTNYGFAASIPSSASSLLTTTRASTGYADTLSGTYLPFLSGIPRITDKGLLVEEARTNSIRNNSMQGAVAGTPGTLPTNWFIGGAAGLTVQLVGTGTENGVDYIDYRFSGTTGGTFATINFEAVGIIAGSNGQTWAHSLFLKRVAGSVTNISGIDNTLQTYTSGSVFLANYTSSVLSSINTTLTRYSAASTVVDATTAFVRSTLLLSYGSGVAIDITLRIGWPQLELGAFATSPIRTTSAAATRAADLIDHIGVVPTFPMTLYAESSIVGATPSTFPGQFGIYDGTNNNVGGFLYNGTNLTVAGSLVGVASGGVEQIGAAGLGVLTVGATTKLALAMNTNDAIMVRDGAIGNQDSAVNLAGPTTRFMVGRFRAGSNYMNGYIRRVAYFPTRLTNAQLQAMTS